MDAPRRPLAFRTPPPPADDRRVRTLQLAPIFRRRKPLRARLASPGVIAALAVLAIGVTQSCRSLQVAERPAGPSAPTPRPAMTGPDIRIRIARQTERAQLTASSAVRITSDRTGSPARTFTPPVAVRLTDLDFRVLDATGHEIGFDRSAPLLVENDAGGPIGVNGALLSGALTLIPSRDVSPGLFDIVERTTIEDYLPGVIAKELYTGWHGATYEAQAIAARSYALQERSRERALNSAFDLESTTEDQAYGGITLDPRALDAVRKTRGMVLTFEGQTLRAYYSSTCGGRPASAKDVWPTGPGYEFNLAEPLQAHPRACACEASPVYRWTVTRPADELVKRIQGFGREQNLAVRNLDGVARVEPVATNEVGRPTRYRIANAQGKWWELSAEQLRVACNYTGSTGLPAITRETRVSSGDLEMRADGKSVVIAGRGFGHGVGLCQFGAEGFAKQGMDAISILARFYPGARIGRAY